MPNAPSWFGLVLVIVLVASELLFCALPALLWALIGRQKLTEAFAWQRTSGKSYVGAALLALGLAFWAQVLIIVQNHVWPYSMTGQQSNDGFLLPLIQQYPVVLILVLPLSAAFSEELLFRGPLQRAFTKRMPVWLAVLSVSLLFAVVHLEIQGFIIRTVLGVVLAILVLHGRSIFPAMLTHFLYDAVLIGSSAWVVHLEGLRLAMRTAGQVDMGMSRLEVFCCAGVGTLLLGLGWRLSSQAWRRQEAVLETASL